MRIRRLVGVLLPVMAALTPLSARAGTNPPPSYASGFTPVVYNSTTGAVRFVKPWGVIGASIPNCTPPAQWQVAGTSYDPILCNTGGSFDARNNEFYTEIPVLTPPSPPTQLAYLNVAYSSSTGDARVVGPWGVMGASIPTCTPPVEWEVAGVTYDPTLCNTGGSFDARSNEFYTELASLRSLDPSAGLNSSTGAANPPSSYSSGYYPIAYTASTGKMRLLRPWGVAGASIPNCTPPAAWQLPGVLYDPTPCNTGGAFDARTNELYTELVTG